MYKENFQELERWEEEMMKEYNFVIHAVPLEEPLVNYHTHGINDNLNHLDFQIVLPLNEEVAGGLFHQLVDAIQKGEKFEEEGYYHNVIQNFPVKLVKKVEGIRPVMRVILPDPEGNFYEKYQSHNPYSYQNQVNTGRTQGFLS